MEVGEGDEVEVGMGSEEEGMGSGVQGGGMAGEVEGVVVGVEVASLPSAARPEGGGRKAPADAPGGQAVPRGPEAGKRPAPPPGSSRSCVACHAS